MTRRGIDQVKGQYFFSPLFLSDNQGALNVVQSGPLGPNRLKDYHSRRHAATVEIVDPLDLPCCHSPLQVLITISHAPSIAMV
jgi:hypothetical protein